MAIDRDFPRPARALTPASAAGLGRPPKLGDNDAGRLGVITEGSLTKGLTARLDADRLVEDVRVGRFVKIEGEKHDFFCLVSDVVLGASNPGVLQEPPEPGDDFLREVFAGTATYGSIVIQPMLMLNRQSVDEAPLDEIGAKPQPVRTIPVHFATVRTAEEADFDKVFAEPGEGSWVIGTPLDMDIPVRLDLGKVAERSNGVFGKSGTGKSMITRLLICGLIKSRRAVNLIFDMHSEYAWGQRDPGTGKVLKSLPELFGNTEIAVYTLQSKRERMGSRKTDGEIRIGMNEIDLNDIAMLADPLNLTDTAVETIYSLQHRFGERWFAELLKMEQADVKEFCDQSNAHPAAVSALSRKLQQIAQLDFVTSDYVSPSNSSIEYVIKSLEQGSNVVLAFEHEDNLLPYMLVANVITRRIHKRWTDLTNEANARNGPRPTPLVITIEEAHKFLSNAAARYTSFGTIAREMRKYNVTLLVVDQRPSGIDPEVLSQIGTRFTCQLNDENDINAILAGVSGASHLRTVLASVDSQQQAMLLGHAVPMPVVVRVRTIDDAFYADVTADRRTGVFPVGRRAIDLTSLPDD